MKRHSNLIFVTILLIFISSCDLSNNKKTESVVNDFSKDLDNRAYNPWLDTKEIQSSLDKILQGDKNAYRKMARLYMLSGRRIEFYYYALIMANKYKSPIAYYDLYCILRDGDGGNLSEWPCDEITKRLALYYLLIAYEKKVPFIEPEVRIYFRHKIPSSKEYKCQESW